MSSLTEVVDRGTKAVVSLAAGDKVLVVLLGAVGDLVRGMALASALKNHSEQIEVHWVVDSRWESLAKLHPGIDRTIPFVRSDGAKGLINAIGLIRQEHYKVCFDMQRIAKSGVLSFASRAPYRLCFNKKNSKEGNYLLNTTQVPAQDPFFDKLQHYFSFLPLCDVSVPAIPDFGVKDSLRAVHEHRRESESPSADLFRIQNGVGIVLGSSWSSKDWFASGYVKLLELLAERGLISAQCPALLLGTGADAALAEKLTGALPELVSSGSLVDATGKTSLVEAAALISGLRFCVGPDSGPAHIAAAVEVPYVALFGPTPPERVGAYGMSDLVVRADIGCQPCYRKTCPGLDTLCMRMISPYAVLEACERAVARQ